MYVTKAVDTRLSGTRDKVQPLFACNHLKVVLQRIFPALTCARKAEMVRLLGDVAERDDRASLRQRKLELELGLASDDSGVESKDLRPAFKVKLRYFRQQSRKLTPFCLSCLACSKLQLTQIKNLV